ncbi:MAG: DUF1353 domain-containing protein [Chthoniobacterales bacterium]
MATSPSGRPSWQRNRIFKFFASIKLAVVLLAVLIIASIAGTIYESSFDAKVARAYVYGSAWFNLWLLLLVGNLACSALSRWPWRKHHVAFLITHLGIITLLFGSLIGRLWGIEGTITLFKGEPPSNRLLVDRHQLRVRDTDGIVKGYPAEFINHPPNPQRPWDLGPLASGARLSIVDYAPAVEGKLNPKPLENGGAPAVHFAISTAMMGQRLESWLMADERDHSSFNMGLATIELKRGRAPSVEPGGNSSPPAPASEETDLEETIFAFAKAPDQQVSKPAKGGSTGAKVILSQPENGNSGTVTIALGEKKWTHDVAAHLGHDVPLEGSAFSLRVDAYWPDFRIDGGKPVSVSAQPNNPAVVVTLRGRGIPTAPVADAHGGAAENPVTAAPNRLTLFIADDGAITYDLDSRKAGHSTGRLEPNAPLPTGWADWQLVVDQTMPHAEAWNDFQPVSPAPPSANLPDGVRIRVQQGDHHIEQWIPAGWQIGVPISPAPIQVAFGWEQRQLPIALELLDFEVQRDEGSDSPAGFKSTVRVTDADGGNALGHCWMNNPFSYPGGWWRAWTGLTYKMSQASWNPENLGQSTIQILRDPGWLLKWVGSILICSGIFMLFYVKKFRRAAAPVRPATAKSAAPAPQLVALLLACSLALTGCGSGKENPERRASREAARLDRQASKARSARAATWGFYSGPIETRWESDGLSMVLMNELRYTDPYGEVWVAPAGSRVNGASIPRAFWSIIGGPFEGKYRNASVLHDVAYDEQKKPSPEVDRMFYNAMRCSGVGALTAKTMYYTLVRHGRHWKNARATAVPAGERPQPAGVEQVQEWIRGEDPTLEQIEARAQAERR